MAESINPTEVRRILDSESPVALLDIRTPRAYTYGHLEEATLVSRRDLEFKVRELVPNLRTPIILCDTAGERSHIDARWLEFFGYETVSYLAGGVTAWERAGFDLVSSVGGVYSTAFNYPSKKFGEEVEAASNLPKFTPDKLKRELDQGDVLVVDVRTPDEHAEMTIPGSINIEGVDLALYVDELRDEDTPVVVHCAGRTRSIIGTATLQRLGIPNVYELENGVMGWELAGFESERGSSRRVAALDVSSDRYQGLQGSAEQLVNESEVSFVTPATLTADSSCEQRPKYVFDVRTIDEFTDGTIPGARGVPGGQLLQTTDRHIAVREADIFVVSNTHVRAAITAYWLSEMGFPTVNVLRGGLNAWTDTNREIINGKLQRIPLGTDIVEQLVNQFHPKELFAKRRRTNAEIRVLNVDRRSVYTSGHIPDAKWIPRNELESRLESEKGGDDAVVVLTCETGRISSFAAAQAQEILNLTNIKVLSGGLVAWKAANLPIVAGSEGNLDEPRESVRKVYEQGREAMRTYLHWEENLVED